MMRLQRFLLFPVFCAALSGCAARGPVEPGASVPEAAPASLSFSALVAELPEGSTQYFAESPFGPATIAAGPLYLSGLGNECRPARVRTELGGESTFAVCRAGEDSAWNFVPPVFEAVPR